MTWIRNMALVLQLQRILLNKHVEGVVAGLCCDVPRRTARGDVARGSCRRRIADVRYMRDRAARGGNTLRSIEGPSGPSLLFVASRSHLK